MKKGSRPAGGEKPRKFVFSYLSMVICHKMPYYFYRMAAVCHAGHSYGLPGRVCRCKNKPSNIVWQQLQAKLGTKAAPFDGKAFRPFLQIDSLP